MPPADADALTKYVREVSNPLKVEVLSDDEAEHSGLITIIGEEVDAAYLEEIKAVTIDHELVETMGKDLKLVYTPLHGTGKMLGERALKQAGFEQFVLVPEQAVADRISLQSNHRIQKNTLLSSMRCDLARKKALTY